MAKIEHYLTGDFDEMIALIEREILKKNFSASLEDGSDFDDGSVKVAIRVFERYSYLGKNRLSLNVTLVNSQGRLFLSAITAGGSQAVFFKVNTWGEENFLLFFQNIIEPYIIN
ncbi:MAG: DUF6054 family protein [Erysipelotrichaceae bacterium]|nr:DUF6054 family protein [Erysipelotrichaceae bacterium]MDD3809440.1 DUF6054 family protein [Erysipelotrichaceae bacterium]